MKKTNEIRTAIMVIAGILLFYFGFNFLKSKDILISARTFYAVYDDVEGLQVGTPVTINGFLVGSVQHIEFANSQAHLVVKFRVNNDFDFSNSSTAQIYEAGLIGGKSLAIIPDFNNTMLAKSGDTLPSSISPGLTELANEKLAPLQHKIEQMIQSADSVMSAIHQTLDLETRKNLQQSVSHFNSSMQEFGTIAASIRQIVEGQQSNFSQTITSLSNTSKNLEQITAQLEAASLDETFENLHQTSESLTKIMATLDEGQGTLGSLIHDKTLYENLTTASESLDKLLEDMRLNPKRYVHFSVFGKKQKPYKTNNPEK